MPGIVGLITKLPRELAEQQLLQMVSTLRHEPFYDTGTFIDESSGVYVGWVVRKGSFSEGMPLRDERRDLVLVFSGEEFSGPGADQQLGQGVAANNASYLIGLYEGGSSFPSQLNGRFHGLVIDRARGKTMLFNDRYGMHRIYYHESGEAFYFAAEAKAILMVCPGLRTLDQQGLGEFIACGCVLENRTLFKDIHVLPPASAWVFRNSSIPEREAYFHPKEWEEQPPLEPEAYYQAIRDIFSRNLPRYFMGPEKIGMSLTGGLDTRMIMAWRKFLPGSFPCYSFGGMFRDCQDVVVARKVAKACGQSHEVIQVADEFLSRFPHYVERTVYLTDGCVGPAFSPDLYVNERAREIAPVRMTGNYGGEVLRRVRAFKPSTPAPGLFHPELLRHVGEAGETYGRLLHGHPLSFAVFRQAPWHHYGLLSLEQTQVSLRSPYLDNDFVRTVFRAPESSVTNDEVSLRLIREGDVALGRIRTDRGLTANNRSLVTSVLHAIIEFTAKAEYAYDYGMPQPVAQIDHRLSFLHIERIFLGRHKFKHFRIWYRDALSGYVKEMLLDRRSLNRSHINRASVETVVRSHIKGERNHTSEIHVLLALELVHRLFVDSR